MKFKVETIYDIEIVEDGLRSAFANASLAWAQVLMIIIL